MAEAGLMGGRKLSWIIMSSDLTSVLTLDLGLRPDSRVITVSMNNEAGVYTASTSRWTGSTLSELKAMGEHIDLNAAPDGQYDLNGQRLSVAVFEVISGIFS
jgi:hypothetical protein